MSEPARPPGLRETVLQFESLGDNCEFGLVQRCAGAEPLGLFRFASLDWPMHMMLEKMVAGLQAGFAGLGTFDDIMIYVYQREYIVNENRHKVRYHTFQSEGQISPEKLRLQASAQLQFLRDKFLRDLQEAQKIFVWKSNLPTSREQIDTLLSALRSYGRNTLLWVVEQDQDHPAGSAEFLGPGLLRGYVERFAPYHDAMNILYEPWLSFVVKFAGFARRIVKLSRIATRFAPDDPRPWAQEWVRVLALMQSAKSPTH